MKNEIKHILAPYVNVGMQNGILYIGFGSNQKAVTEQIDQQYYFSLLKFFKQPHTIHEAELFLKNTHSLDQPAIKQILDDIVNYNFLIQPNVFDKKEEFSRIHLFYNYNGLNPIEVQKNLGTKTVAIFGCGGVGSFLSTSLAGIGVGNLILVDSDTIELSNLNRQILFTLEDIGKSKVDILKKAFKARFSHTKVTTYNKFIDDDFLTFFANEPMKPDLIILSADSPGCLKMVNKYCVSNKIAMLNISYVQDIAVWGPFYIPGKSGCYDCRSHFVSLDNLTPNQIEDITTINEGFQTSSINAISMLTSSLGLLDSIKYLCGFDHIPSLNTRIGLYTHNLEIKTQDYSYNPACKTCSQE